MTIKEMSDAIEKYCGGQRDCYHCKLWELVKNGDRTCFSYREDDLKNKSDVVENYKFLFGKPESVTEECESVNHVEKNCNTCKFEHREEYEHPCKNCRCTLSPFDSKYESTPFLWESPDSEPVPEPDVVNHPSHYCQEGSMECIDEMVAVFGREAVMNFCLLNVWKYRKRAFFKNGEEDLKKSDWYMKKYVELKGEL